jgi:uncharacterized coiled-coil DUF342 family protein
MADKQAYVEQARTRLGKLGAQIAIVEERADEAGPGAEAEYREQAEALRSRYVGVVVRLQELEAIRDESWQDLQPSIEGALGELKHSLANVMMRMG